METHSVGRVQPHTADQLAASRAKLLDMAVKDKERMMLEESRNKVESYIYRIKNTLADKEDEISKVSNKKQRDEAMKLALDAQEWMDDEGYGADLATMEDKYATLSVPFEKIMLRLKEKDALPQAITALQKKLTEVEQLMAKWEKDRPQVTEEERNRVLEKVEEVRKWLSEKEKEQSKKKAHEEPVFLSEEVPGQMKPIEVMVMRLSRKPKPKPPKKEENKTSTENATDSETLNATENETKEGGDDSKEEKDAEEAQAESDENEAKDTEPEL